jgi:hypothetical protein
MNDLTDRGKGFRLTLAFFLALTMPLGGLCFGVGQIGREQAAEMQTAPSVKSSGSDDSVGIEPGSALALKIEKRHRVRIVTSSGRSDIRRPVIVAGGVKSGQGEPAMIPWAGIQKIRVPKRATLTGTLVGFGLGAALGIAWGVEEGAESGGDYLMAASIMGAMGAASGALIGTLFIDWKTVYEAQASPPVVARVALAPVRRGGAMTLSVAF